MTASDADRPQTRGGRDPILESDTGDRLLRATVEASPCGSIVVNDQGRIVLVNGEIERLFGYERRDLIGRSAEELLPSRHRAGNRKLRPDYFAQPTARVMGEGCELSGLRSDGSEFPIEMGLTPVETKDGRFIVAAVVDITQRVSQERRRKVLEQELGRHRRLESVGTLASGVAHEFNNVLAAILGFAELACAEPTRERANADMRELIAATLRGRDLVARLQAFARRTPVAAVVTDLCRVVDDVLPVLHAMMPVDVTVQAAHRVPTAPVAIDVAAVREMLRQLAANAAYAMPAGGSFELSVDRIEVTELSRGTLADLPAGSYVRLSCRDTGSGMDAATRDRAFDPFFTTRPPGHGSGLGLYVVHGVMLEQRGGVTLESEPGAGTLVHCLFPSGD